jgi:hypothetical protein
MNEKFLVLKNSIERDLETIAIIYDDLDRHPLIEETDQDTLIVIAYYLHNLYNAFENIFRNVATVFENSVEDTTRWHTQLLERMRLEVLPLRPAVISEEMYGALDELRRFRHVFRHAYILKLDALRLQIVMREALHLKSRYPTQLQQFIDFLQDLT